MRPAASWLAVPAFAVAIAAERAAGLDATASVADAAAGLALLGGAATLAGARGGRRSAALMALTSLTWLAGDFWPALLFAHRGPLVHLLLGYPRGRVASRAAGAVVAAAYVDGLIPALARKDTATVVLAAGVLAVALLQQRRTGGPERRARLAALGATALLATVVAGAAIARAASWDADRAFLLLYDAAVVVIAVTLAADLRWGRWTRAAVTGLVVDLGRLERPGSLGSRLGRAVGDPGLVIAYPVADRHVDDQGRPVVLPEPGSDRAVTPVLDGHERVATLIHDAALLDD